MKSEIVKHLSGSDVYKTAMNIETEGMEFYTKMLGITKNTELKRIFKKLIQDEVKHYKLFKRLHDKTIGKNNRGQGKAGRVNTSYMKSVIESGVFYDVDYLPSATVKTLTEKDGILIGIQAEKDSILFYTEAYQNNKNPKSKKAFQRLITEEKGHLVALHKMFKKLKKK